MRPDRIPPNSPAPITCIWCGATARQQNMPRNVARVFCSRNCEVEANFWLFQELCAIEITHPPFRVEDDDSDNL